MIKCKNVNKNIRGEIMKELKLYSLKEYVSLLKEEKLVVSSELYGQDDTKAERITYNSKEVTKDTLFICKGAAFKAAYLEEAVKNGAVCYISEKKYELEKEVPFILVTDIRKAMSLLANFYYNEPWKELTVLGVGGTKGKSTSVYYLKSMIDEYLEAQNKKESAVISTIDTYDGKQRFESHMTTPEAIELQQHIRNAVESKIEYLEMEVSSQALKYYRVEGMRFNIGIFLNISEDHISPAEHVDFEDYISSKMKMFEKTDTAIINLDADCIDRVMKEATASKEIITFSRKNESADFYAYNIRKEEGCIKFCVRCKQFDKEFVLTMLGLFNVENALAAIAAAVKLGIPEEIIYSGLKKAKSKGRMESFESKDGKIVAIVDYAHNKLSFEKVFRSMKEEYPKYAIKTIFGCPGDKAFLRRKDLGTVAGKYSNEVYLAADDPGSEKAEDISKEIAVYVDAQNCPYEIIEDRGEAIKTAISRINEKTILLVLGKGRDSRQKYGREYIPCPSDADYVIKYIKEYDEQ